MNRLLLETNAPDSGLAEIIEVHGLINIPDIRIKHTCMTPDAEYVKRLFLETDPDRVRSTEADLLEVGIHQQCPHCYTFALGLSEALSYHHAVLTSKRDAKKVVHYALQRRHTLKELGYSP